MSISAYLKKKALGEQKQSPEALMQIVEVLSVVAQSINQIATAVLRNKAIYESDILELLDRMTALEEATAEVLKEVRTNGNSRKQKHKGNSVCGGEV